MVNTVLTIGGEGFTDPNAPDDWGAEEEMNYTAFCEQVVGLSDKMRSALQPKYKYVKVDNDIHPDQIGMAFGILNYFFDQILAEGNTVESTAEIIEEDEV